MLPGFANKIVTVQRPTRKASRGTSVVDWSQKTSHEVSGCSFQPSSTSSTYETREGVKADAILYAPPDADIMAGDRIVYQDATYSVNGAPMKLESPTGALSHTTVYLEVWHG